MSSKKSKSQNQVATYGKKQSRIAAFFADFAGYKKYYALTLMFIPVVLYFFVFKYIPMGGIIMAFKDYKIREGIFGSDCLIYSSGILQACLRQICLYPCNTFLPGVFNTILPSIV